MVKTRGNRVEPEHVERTIVAHPLVEAAVVVAVPHRSWGSAIVAQVVPVAGATLGARDVKAFVAPRPGTTLDFAVLHAYAGERLAAYKVPRFWQQVDALPRTATQRVAKHELPTGHPDDEYDAEEQAKP